MKNLLTISIVLFAFISYGQDTTYYDSNNRWVKTQEQASYYQIIQKSGSMKSVFKSGQVRSELNSDKNAFYYKEWYENGQLRRVDTTNLNGELTGHILSYWENGALKRNDIYEKNKLIKGDCFDINGNKIDHTNYLVKPIFQGGDKGIMRYLASETTYPQSSAENGIQGTAYVSFTITIDGCVSEIKLENKIDHDLGIEALRVVIKMPRWTPGLCEGEPVNVRYIMPVKFILQ
jgi:protein TonB